MGKTTFIGLLFILATIMVVTKAFVFPPPSVIKKSPFVVSNERESSSSEEDISDESDDDKERMLCNVIVRATHDLHFYQKKSVNDITSYLDGDCKNLADEELIEQCHEMVAEYGAKIYEHVKDGTEISQICQKINDYSETDLDDNEGKIECSSKSKDKCQCCRMHVEKRKMRLRYIVKQMARKRMHMCRNSRRPHRCRYWIREKERRVLKRIEKICPHAVCERLGYCKKMSENNGINVLLEKMKVEPAVESPSLLVELLLDQQLETYFTKNVCNEFEQFQTLCVHLSASVDSRRYMKVYMAMLQNDTTWIEKNLQKEVQSTQIDANAKPCDECNNVIQIDANAKQCDECKNVIQISTNFYTKNLETVRNTLMGTCGHCSSKEKCQEVFNKQFDTINNYLQSMKSDQLCSINGRCTLNTEQKCTTCIQRFQPREDAANKAIDRLTSHFTDRCTKWNIPQCQQFVSEMTAELRSFMSEFDLQSTCSTMGLCEQSAVQDLNDYERAYVEVMNKEVCPMLGPFAALCQQVVRGDSTGMEKITFNATNIHEFFLRCEENTDEVATTGHCSQEKDKCQCCINRVIQKKKCLKKRVAKYVWHMKELCKRCPAREKCERHWEEKKARWDAKIDKICPKKACTRMGYCNGKQLFGQQGEEPLPAVVLNTSVQSKNENEKQPEVNKI